MIRGVPFRFHSHGDHVSEVIRMTRDFYEASILDHLATVIRGGTLVDVGAHIGNHSAYLARFVPHTAIHAFEPLPANLALLHLNVPDDVQVHPVALGDRAGTVHFERDAVNSGHSRISAAGEIEVEMRTLDSFALEDVTLLKIDVEGFEPQVLTGARETIDRWHPLILIEDWTRGYGELLPGYRLAAEWENAHQTFLYEWP